MGGRKEKRGKGYREGEQWKGREKARRAGGVSEEEEREEGGSANCC